MTDVPVAPFDADDEIEGGEGLLGRLSDQGWRDAHDDLIAAGVLPAAETAYTWAPGQVPQ